MAGEAGADLAVVLVEVGVLAQQQLSTLVANMLAGRGGFGGAASFGPPDQVFGMRNQMGVFAPC